MKVKVTREHIINGKRGAPFSCPVSLAICDANPNFINSGVGTTTIETTDRDGNWSCYVAPKSVEKFVRAYDDEEPVEPFDFVMPTPDYTVVKKAVP